MATRRPDHEYREADVMSATPERLVVLLYDRMIRDLETSIAAQREGDVVLAVDRVHHSQLIVTELAQYTIHQTRRMAARYAVAIVDVPVRQQDTVEVV